MIKVWWKRHSTYQALLRRGEARNIVNFRRLFVWAWWVWLLSLADITFIINRGCHTLCILMNCSSNSFKEKFPPRVKAETHKFEALWKFPDHKNSREMLFLTQIIINNLLSSPLLTGYKLMSGHLAFGLTSYLQYSTSHLSTST